MHVAIGRLKNPVGSSATNITDQCPGGREREVQAGDRWSAYRHTAQDCT